MDALTSLILITVIIIANVCLVMKDPLHINSIVLLFTIAMTDTFGMEFLSEIVMM